VVLEELPRTYVLFPAFPNPFNPQTTVSFFLPEESKVRLRVYDLLGRPVRNLSAGRLSAGYHTLTWKGRNEFGRTVAAGVYLLEMRAQDFRQVRKLLLLK
jgi:flagellar hook assembly protein FlgD